MNYAAQLHLFKKALDKAEALYIKQPNNQRRKHIFQRLLSAYKKLLRNEKYD